MHDSRPRLGIMSAPALSCSTPAGTKFQCDYPESDRGSGSGQCVEVRALAVSAAVSSAARAAPGAAAPCRKTLADQRLGSNCVTWRWQRHGPAGRPGCDHRAACRSLWCIGACSPQAPPTPTLPVQCNYELSLPDTKIHPDCTVLGSTSRTSFQGKLAAWHSLRRHAGRLGGQGVLWDDGGNRCHVLAPNIGQRQAKATAA